MSRLPFTIDAQFKAYKVRHEHIATDKDVCIVCGALVIFAATVFGAMLGWVL